MIDVTQLPTAITIRTKDTGKEVFFTLSAVSAEIALYKNDSGDELILPLNEGVEY